MLRITATAILLTSVASFAYAGDITPTPAAPVIAAPISSAPFWAGAYVGAQLGYSYGDFDLDLGSRPGDFDNDSVIGGITAGYLWDIGNGWYVGPEFQYDFADITVTDATSGDTASFDEIARLKFIAGYELGNGLLYGSAGVAYSSFDNAGAVFDGLDGSDTSYVLGFGYDHRIAEDWTLGGEYMYHSFSNAGAAGGDVDVNTVHIKATYRF
ncbi:hypothetical protein ROLI_031940 [Roseobacter fucihabitans]|uniref:Outer membrane protein beta-barrel domain-containing protein n=1 Tax=Roseobacter fucihabitans TaxID=1537242 RepID=A0ABZ2BWK4_9RHOB|nr:outer membrane beta-barrel protein [Roseobacter litoralis]MBC6965000.1 Autotransporter beta-domain protein [Roseobacter litoralis]